MRVAILGAEGQLGRTLCKMLPAAIPLSRTEADLTNPDSVKNILTDVQPEAVINCAAYTAVDLAETEVDAAMQVNSQGVQALAQHCNQQSLQLVHISSDYVFGGDLSRTKPYQETDQPEPVSIYGASKLAGENAVRTQHDHYFILRTCGLYGVPKQPSTGNFIETMIRLGEEQMQDKRGELRIVSDQICTPTSTCELAKVISDILSHKNNSPKDDSSNHYGLYHATCSGEVSWYALANAVFEELNMPIKTVPISTEEFGAKAERPRYSVLNCNKLKETFGIELLDWRTSLKQYLEQRHLQTHS